MAPNEFINTGSPDIFLVNTHSRWTRERVSHQAFLDYIWRYRAAASTSQPLDICNREANSLDNLSHENPLHDFWFRCLGIVFRDDLIENPSSGR